MIALDGVEVRGVGWQLEQRYLGNGPRSACNPKLDKAARPPFTMLARAGNVAQGRRSRVRDAAEGPPLLGAVGAAGSLGVAAADRDDHVQGELLADVHHIPDRADAQGVERVLGLLADPLAVPVMEIRDDPAARVLSASVFGPAASR
jgi:hypothetical protein